MKLASIRRQRVNLRNPLVILLAASIVLLFLRLFFMIQYNLLVEEAYYWNYAKHLDYSYLDHPPMVALLIKASTLMFGTNEWGVRFATLLCWIFTLYFSFQLTNLIKKGAGLYAVMLITILPFFFIHSMIITPDIPLILSWSAALYYLYRAIVLEQPTQWYWAGLWTGLGLLSKYTIILLAPASIIYLLVVPSSRKWFLRKEPYACALIAFIVFSPVIYWNATHQWASFLFQSTRRFQDNDPFSLHILLGLLVVFLTPAGIFGAYWLFRKKTMQTLTDIDVKTQVFLRIFTSVPLVFFAIFSLFHLIKVNWIGPSLLAVIPWLAILLYNNTRILGVTSRNSWAATSLVLFVFYSTALLCIVTGKPEKVNHYLFHKLMPWENFTQKVHQIASAYEEKSHEPLIIVPLDIYNIGSELTFYQQKLFSKQQISSTNKVIGAHIFGSNSLMYQYWGSIDEVHGKTLMLLSNEAYRFNNEIIFRYTKALTPLTEIHAYDSMTGHQPKTFYYQIVQMGEAVG